MRLEQTEEKCHFFLTHLFLIGRLWVGMEIVTCHFLRPCPVKINTFV